MSASNITDPYNCEGPPSGDTDYINKLIQALQAVDAHDHSANKGLPVQRVGSGAVDGTTLEVVGNKAQLKASGVTLSHLAATLQAYLVPSGTVVAFAGTTPPTGWLACNGSTVARATYAALFTAIGTAHGSGDGSTTFHLPDYRGRFLRGVDGGVGRDPDRASRTASNSGGATGDNVGSVQGQATKKNGLALTDPGHTHGIGTGTELNPSGGRQYDFESGTRATTKSTSDSATTGITLGNGDNETRPVNSNVLWIIKT